MNQTGTLAMTQPPLDLTPTGVRAFLDRIGPAARIVEEMERQETWPCPDTPEVRAAIAQFCSLLNEHHLQALAFQADASLLQVMAYLRASQCLLLLERLSTAAGEFDLTPGDILWSMSDVVQKQPEHQPALEAAAGRLIHLDRVQLLKRVYGPARAEMIARVLRELYA